MNKYCIRTYLHQKFADFSSSLKLTSYDDSNGKYLCNDETTAPVYDFDQYVRQNFDQSKLPASPDAVYLGEKKFYFIEFKNQHPAKIDAAEIKNKFSKGTEVLKEVLSGFLPKDVEFVFCVVHQNRNLSNAHFIANYIEGRKTNFGLEAKNKELGNFYDDIITESVDFYVEKFPELVC